jgi:hypothetical protein
LGIAPVVAGLHADTEPPAVFGFLECHADADFLLLSCARCAASLRRDDSNPQVFGLLSRQTQRKDQKDPGQYDKRRASGIRTTH